MFPLNGYNKNNKGDDIMTGNEEILNYIHQNAQMGIETLPELIKISTDNEFIEELRSQFTEYKKIFDETSNMLDNAKSIPKMAKFSSYIMIKMELLMDKSPSHIAEMLIKGSLMGIIEIEQNFNDYKDANREILDLANKLLQTEKNNIENLKKYLKNS